MDLKDVSPKKNYRPTVIEIMLNVTNHQGNANQNHNDMEWHAPHTCQDRYDLRKKDKCW